MTDEEKNPPIPGLAMVLAKMEEMNRDINAKMEDMRGDIKSIKVEMEDFKSIKAKMEEMSGDIKSINRKFEDERKWNDTRFARINMLAQMDGGSYKSVPLVPTGHALSESSKDYRRVKSQGR